MEVFSKIFSEYGFGVAMAIVFVSIFWYMMRWMARQVERIMDAADKRDVCNIALLEHQREVMAQRNEQDKEFHVEVKSAHDFQRQEHERMINALDEIVKTVLRINGYKS
jgi:Na+-transporting methylmalonyl-CoA/oxaloacetate decarboxylase gamma subunit